MIYPKEKIVNQKGNVMFCKHEWKLLSEVTTKSKLQHMRDDCSFVANEFRGTEMVSRKHIQVFTCNKCGKLKRFVEDI